MLLIDDILFSPFAGLLYIFRELHKAVQQDSVSEAEAIRAEMSELYMQLETGQITEDEADEREKVLLDRLDDIEAGRTSGDQEDDEDDEEEAEEDEEDDEDEAEDEDGIFEVTGDSKESPLTE